MKRNKRTQRTRKAKWWPVIIGCLTLIVAVVVVMITKPEGPPTEEKEKQEFTKFQVVQFYLHLPGGDIIVGRKNPKFNELMELTRQTVTSISAPQQSPFTETDVQEAVYDIQQKSISLSVWFPNSQKISTKIPAKGKEPGDKYGNRVFETDRLLIVFGGPYQGQVLSRVSGKDEWDGWKASPENMRKLVELIRSGQL